MRARKFKLLMDHNMYNGTRSKHKNTLETFHQNRLESPGIQEQEIPRRASKPYTIRRRGLIKVVLPIS